MAERFTTEQLEGAAREMRDLGTDLDSDLARAVAHAYLALRERWARVEAGMQRAPIVAAEPAASAAAIDRLTHAVLLVAECQALTLATKTQTAQTVGALNRTHAEEVRNAGVAICHRIATLRDRIGETGK
jgi:hypothetical protein